MRLAILPLEDITMTQNRERHRHPRRSSALSARAVFNNRSPALDCMAQNRSSSRAHIAFAAPLDRPDEFALEIPSLKVAAQWHGVEPGSPAARSCDHTNGVDVSDLPPIARTPG
jgi:hypothetical protein